MQTTVRLLLVEAMIDNVTGYLTSNSMWDQETALTQDPLIAKNFEGSPILALERFMGALVVPGDEVYAKSGLRVDQLPQLVELLVTTEVKQISRRQGRDLHTYIE